VRFARRLLLGLCPKFSPSCPFLEQLSDLQYMLFDHRDGMYSNLYLVRTT
jgi:hypothetical protein